MAFGPDVFQHRHVQCSGNRPTSAIMIQDASLVVRFDNDSLAYVFSTNSCGNDFELTVIRQQCASTRIPGYLLRATI
jgi:hypothetical protein